jgi:hypothetical protein
MSKAEDRREAYERAVDTKIRNMNDRIRKAKLTIVPCKTTEQIYRLAMNTHGGNYAGDPGEFNWSDRTARNCIRHNLTNYEELWSLINRGETGSVAYQMLRNRVDKLIDETYPQFAKQEAAA